MSDTPSQDAARDAHETTHATGSEKWIGHLAMVSFALLIAGSFSLGSMAAPHIGPAAINVVRFVLGVIIMGVAVIVMTRALPPLPKSPGKMLILGVLMGTYFVTMYVALKVTHPVSTGAVFTLTPLMVAIFGYLFLRQVPRAIVIVSIIIAASGAIWVIFGGSIDRLRAFDVGYGEWVYFFGCICHAAYAPLVRKFNRGEPVVVFTFWTLCAVTVCIAAYGWQEMIAVDWLALPAIVWWTIIYLAVAATAATFFLLQVGSMRLPASKVMAYGYLTPTFIIILEGLIGHGWAPASVMTGALITVSALVVLALSPDA